MKKVITLYFSGCLLVLLFSGLNVLGQLPGPATLGVGLSGITGQKGTIDTEVLSEIIAEKQTEIKKEFIRRNLSKMLQRQSYALWEFGYLTTGVLLDSRNEEVITKKLLEHSANLSLIYDFAEYGLKNQGINTELNSISKEFWTKHRPVCCWNCNDGSGSLVTLQEMSLVQRGVYLDLVFDVLINNPQIIREFGFFADRLPFGMSYYRAVSKYLSVRYHTNVIQPDNLGEPDISGMAHLDKVHQILETHLKFFLNNYIVLKEAKEYSGLKELQETIDSAIVRVNRNAGKYLGVLEEQITQSIENGSPNKIDSLNIFKAIVPLAIQFNKDIQKLVANVDSGKIIPVTINLNEFSNGAVGKVTDPLIDELAKVSKSIESFVTRVSGRNPKYYVNDVYYIKEKVKPLVAKLVASRGLPSEYMTAADAIEKVLLHSLLRETVANTPTELKGPTLDLLIGNRNVDPFVARCGQLAELNQPVFYEQLLDNLKNKIQPYADIDPALNTLFSLLSIVEMNTLVDKTSNTLEIDVEAVILWLFNSMVDKLDGGKITPYFTIGLNYTILPDVWKIENFSYASEKIGLSYKLFDFKHQYSRKPVRIGEYGQRVVRNPNPVVSNFHLLGYSSGLLYTLGNATTNKNFDSPLFAVGFGFTFFNSLELNASRVWALAKNSSGGASSFYQLSFDIRITDYISAANKKRRLLKSKSGLDGKK